MMDKLSGALRRAGESVLVFLDWLYATGVGLVITFPQWALWLIVGLVAALVVL